MATDRDTLYTALRNADAAGDAQAATRLAAYIKALPAEGAAAPTAPAAPSPEQPAGVKGIGDFLAAGPEAGLNALTGMVAKPVADIAGLGAGAYDVLSGHNEGNAGAFRDYVRDALTYQPRTEAGQAVAQYNPAALVGRGVNAIGGGLESAIAPEGASTARQMLGAGVHEAVNQAPALLGAKVPDAGAAAQAALRGKAQGLMQSALKPDALAQRTGRAENAVNTMLDKGYNVSQGGLNKMQLRVGALNKQIADAVNASPAVVDKQAVGYRLQGVMDDFIKQVNPSSDMAAIQRAWDDFLDHPNLIGKGKIPVREAQEMKQATYKALGNKNYGELKGADQEAQKALARGLKEEIANAVPAVKPLNAEETKLLDALSITEKRLLMDANKNPFGLAWVATNPTKMAGFLADRSPLFKSLVARMLNQAGNAAPSLAAGGPSAGLAATGAANAANAPSVRERLAQQQVQP